jgi:hypothetical protein
MFSLKKKQNVRLACRWKVSGIRRRGAVIEEVGRLQAIKGGTPMILI